MSLLLSQCYVFYHRNGKFPMPKRNPPKMHTTINKTSTFRLPADFDPNAVAFDLDLSLGDLIRFSIKEYALTRGVKLKPRRDLSAV